MKPRKVVVMIEMITGEKLRFLRDRVYWEDVLYNGGLDTNIHQIQANVVKPLEGGKKTP